VKVIIYDASVGGFLGASWASWAKVQAARGWKVLGVKSWDDAIGKLTQRLLFEDGSVDEIQLWGHGSPGIPLIGGEQITTNVVVVLRRVLTAGSLVWFRMCSVFFGEKGRQFAEQTSRILGCRVAGHTHIIGPFQSGLYSVSPGKGTDWDLRYDATPWRKVVSGWWEPRTILCTRMSVPEGW
jgi:hypothetical protein